MCWHANCAMGCLISFPDPCTRNGLNLSTLIYWIKALSGARIVVKEKEKNEKWDGLSGVARPVSFAECVDMRIGQWVVWFHLRTLCSRNGLDLSTLIHWISTGLGWDYSDSEILDTRPSVSLCQPFALYQIRIFTNFQTAGRYFAICSSSCVSASWCFQISCKGCLSSNSFSAGVSFVKSLCFVMES